MRDVLIVCRKELAELFSSHASRRAHLLTMAGQVGVFGALIPYFMAPLWLNETPALSFIFLLLPLALSSSQSAMVFAGERERGTLEALLATPLSVPALFFGKALAVLVQVYGIIVSSTALSVAVLNLWVRVHDLRGTFMYSGPALFALLGLSLALAALATSTGVIISLRAPSVRTAQMTTTLLSVFCLLPLMAGWVTIRFAWNVVLPATLALLAAAAGVTALALVRFARAASISVQR
jgi:ABC-type Na+ efflux pump permease subunit